MTGTCTSFLRESVLVCEFLVKLSQIRERNWTGLGCQLGSLRCCIQRLSERRRAESIVCFIASKDIHSDVLCHHTTGLT